MRWHNDTISDEDTSTEHSKKLKDLRDSLVQLHGELKRRSDVSFEVVLIPMNQASCPEDSTTGIKQLFSQEDCPFLLISSEKAERIQVNLLSTDELFFLFIFSFI